MLRYYLIKNKYQVYTTIKTKQIYFGSFSDINTVKKIEKDVNNLLINGVTDLNEYLSIKNNYVKDKLSQQNSQVLTYFPELLNEYHKKNTINPNFLCSGSNKKVWWQCSKFDDHEWEARVYTRTIIKSGCPYCTSKLVCNNNCLATTHPELAKEWHPTKNGDLTPFDILSCSHKKVWWQCSKFNDHEWISTVLNRTFGSKCSCCGGLTIVKSNCLATTYPELAKEWHPTKNGDLTPFDVGYGTNKKVWWACNNKNHNCYLCSINGRIRGRGCPICKQPKGERRIQKYLESNNIEYKRQFSFPDCKSKNILFFDFAVFSSGSLLKLIEYQGELHFQEGRFKDANVRLKEVQHRDEIKRKYCKTNNISLLEIKFNDFHNIEKILNLELRI